MALQTFGTSIGPGFRAPLGTTDSAFIAAGGLVSSSDNVAIRGSGSNHTVHVQGTVVGAGGGIFLGIVFGTTSGEHVLIESSGFVGSYGGTPAVAIEASNSLVENRGRVYSIGADFTAAFGVAMAGDGAGTSRLINSGSIEADGATHTGVIHAGTETLVVTNSGTIKGEFASFFGADSAIESVTNTGRMIGDINLGGGNDVYSGAKGRLSGHLLGGAGNDIAIGGIDNDWFEGGTQNDALTGNAGNDRLLGEAGNDTLNGGLGNDILNGGANNDRLFGGAGNDNLTGGLNNDFFVFNTALNASTNRDVVTDFNHANDTFQLENAIFAKLGAGVHGLNPAFFRAGAVAADANDYIVYNRASGVLSYDSNGNAAGGAVAFAVLTNRPVLAANDFAVI